MAIAAGKSAGKSPRMTDKAFKPPTEVAMAMTGNVTFADEAAVVFRTAEAGLLCPRFDLGFDFIIHATTPAQTANSPSHLSVSY